MIQIKRLVPSLLIYRINLHKYLNGSNIYHRSYFPNARLPQKFRLTMLHLRIRNTTYQPLGWEVSSVSSKRTESYSPLFNQRQKQFLQICFLGKQDWHWPWIPFQYLSFFFLFSSHLSSQAAKFHHYSHQRIMQDPVSRLPCKIAFSVHKTSCSLVLPSQYSH